MVATGFHPLATSACMPPARREAARWYGQKLCQALAGLARHLGAAAAVVYGVSDGQCVPLDEIGYADDDRGCRTYPDRPEWIQRAIVSGHPEWASPGDPLRRLSAEIGLAWPIQHRGVLCGLLVLEWQGADRSERWLVTLEAVQTFWGALVAECLANYLWLRREAEISLLDDLRSIPDRHSFNDAFAPSLTALRELTGAAQIVLVEIDRAGFTVQTLGLSPVDDVLGRLALHPLDHPAVRRCVETRSPGSISQPFHDPCLPLLLPDQVVGVLLMKCDRGGLMEGDIRLGQAVAAEIARAIDRQRIERVLDDRSRALETARHDVDTLGEALVDAMQTRDRFLSKVGQELRVPLTSILGHCESLLEPRSDLARAQLVQIESLKREGEHLLRMINDLLVLSRLERGGAILTRREINLAQFLKRIEVEFSPLARRNGIQFQVQSDPAIETIACDEKQMRYALFQLLDNAFKFTPPEGTIEVVGRLLRADPEPRCEISVRDTGTGISPRRRQRIFQAFNAEDGVTVTPTTGLGVGLAIAQHILSLHGTRLSCESESDRGSRFWFDLPCGVPSELKGTPRVLIVEDDTNVCQLFRALVEREGYEAIAFENAESALEWLFGNHGGRPDGLPDAILLDVVLPGMDGFEFCRQVKEREETRHIPIIMSSSYSDTTDKLKGFEAGAYDFVGKPVNARELGMRLKSAVGRKREYDQILQDYTLVHRMAITDGLTGLFNHAYLVKELAKTGELARMSAQPLSVVMLDVDLFKNFNDTHGHEAGNLLLRSLANLVTLNFRQGDLVARYGGEEFVIVLPNTTRPQAASLAERLRKQVEEYPFPGGDTQPLGHVTISLGVANYPADTDNIDDLLDVADQALYQAKADGRNRVCVPAATAGSPVPEPR